MKEYNHVSTISRYRAPLGAVKCNNKVKLVVDAPEGASTISIVLDCQGDIKSFPMKKEKECFVGEITTPESHMVCTYYFKIENDGQTCYLGCNNENGTGGSCITEHIPAGFQMTVYDESFTTPDWSKKGIMYQIFPDRFAQGDYRNFRDGAEYHRSMGRRVYKHATWNERPIWKPIEGYENYDPIDYFGGDLRGIIKALPKLADMGVTVIYLNPIVEAASNHRYNTADYYKVDPILGDLEDFKELCRISKIYDIKIIIDGVFSHTGSDSRYFNKNNNYDTCGAYQDSSSPYYSWYKFGANRDEYESWWGFKTLPEVNELDPTWQEMVVSGQNSVIKHWLRAGASGVRLDVADELPDEVIDLMRSSLKEESKDNLLLGEVWEDATTKFSYGKKREYCLGQGLDCVMNYPLRKAIVAFLRRYINAGSFMNFLLTQQNNYPKEMYYSQMNLLSSHDVARIKTVLGTGNEGDGLTREEQGRFVMSKNQVALGERLTRLAYAIVFSIPGMPCVYYGDEQGMEGFKDPFNRETYVDRGHPLKKDITELAHLRNRLDCLKTGFAGFDFTNSGAIVILRAVIGQVDSFGNKAKDGVVISIINSAENKLEETIDIYSIEDGLSLKERKAIENLKFSQVEKLFGKGQVQILPDGKLEIQLNAQDGIIIQLK